MTTFQNIAFCYFLNDLAICQIHVIFSKCFIENNLSWKTAYTYLLKGYETKYKLTNLELAFLNRLILINFVFLILKSEEKKKQIQQDCKIIMDIFDYFYLDSNLDFTKTNF